MSGLKVMGIDPGLTRTAYAVVTQGAPGSARGIVDAGYLTPDSATAPAFDRAHSLAEQLIAIAYEHGVGVVVLETPAQQAPRGQTRRRGQALYGMAVGMIGGVFASEWLGPERTLVAPAADVWTRGVPKAKRQKALALRWPAYQAAMAAGRDKGADVADAIELPEWWLDVHQVAPGSCGGGR